MNAARQNTLFSVRYAVRVLERWCRLHRRIDFAIRGITLLSGMTAYGALIAMEQRAALVLGVLFAVLQVIDVVMRPGDAAVKAGAQARVYKKLLAEAESLDDVALETAYRKVCEDDDIIPLEAVRHIAYNDVVIEKGFDAQHLYLLDRWERFVACIA